MKILLIIILFFPLLVQAANDLKSPTLVYIKKTIAGNETISKFQVPNKEIFVERNDFWRSKLGIECTAMLVATGIPPLSGTFECKAPEGYNAQIVFDCSKNYSEKTGAYLFFGLVGAEGNNGNFYVWCE
jgi:hypothetical protein